MAAKPSANESERDRLRAEYRRATERYTSAVGEMTRQRETEHGEDFDKLVKHLRKARAETAEARRALKSFASERLQK